MKATIITTNSYNYPEYKDVETDTIVVNADCGIGVRIELTNQKISIKTRNDTVLLEQTLASIVQDAAENKKLTLEDCFLLIKKQSEFIDQLQQRIKEKSE